jgi:hypothetical protein
VIHLFGLFFFPQAEGHRPHAKSLVCFPIKKHKVQDSCHNTETGTEIRDCFRKGKLNETYPGELIDKKKYYFN